MAEMFVVVALGSGFSGQIAAIRAAQLGLKMERQGGRTCAGRDLHQHRLHSFQGTAAVFRERGPCRKDFVDHGIDVGVPTVDGARFLARKDHVTKQNNDGIAILSRKHMIAFFHGHDSFNSIVGEG